MHVSVILAGCGIAAAAAALRRLTGMGFAMVSVAFLSLMLRPQEAVLITLVLQLFLGVRNARMIVSDTCWRLLPWMLAAALVATPTGLGLVHAVSEHVLRLLIGITVLLGLVPLLSNGAPRSRTVEAGPAATLTSGFLAGFLNSVAAMPAPPLLLYLMRLPGISLEQRRATLITIFTLLSTASLAGRAVSGDIDRHSVIFALLLCPATLIGDYIGRNTPWSFNRTIVDRLSVAVVVVSAATLVGSAL